MLAAENVEAIRVGEEALEMAERLGLGGIRASAMVNVGTSRAALGEDEGMAMLAEGVAIAREANEPYEVCRAMGNRATWLWALGELAEPPALWQAALREAEAHGQKAFARWFSAVIVQADYELGDWNAAAGRCDAFLAEVEAGSPHYLASQCYMWRGYLRVGRGDVDGAVADTEQAVELARKARDPQALFPVYGGAAHVFMQLGDSARALPLADEFLAAVTDGRELGFGIAYVHELAWVLAVAGRGAELAAALAGLPQILWVRIGATFAGGDPMGAAELCAEHGAAASEAYCRLAAARDLVAEGRRAEADEHLRRALAFYRSVQATWYVREGEDLLAVSA